MEITCGEILKQERIKKGIEIPEIEEKTKIRKEYILALEENNFALFPAPIYLIGILKKYAKFLGLNTEEIIEIFKKQYNSQDKQNRSLNQVSQIKIKTKKRKYISIYLEIFFFLILLIGSGCFIYYLNSIDAAIDSNIKLPKTEILVGFTQINVECFEKCWVRVTKDGEVIFDKIMFPQETEMWSGKEIILELGNVFGVKVYQNGKEIDVISDSYQGVNRLIFHTGY